MSRAGAVGAAAGTALAAILVWRGVLEPWREDRHWRHAARTGLEALAELEQTHCFLSGRYTSDLLKLASHAPEPAKVTAMIEEVFEPGSLRIAPETDRVRIEARALDRRRTRLAFEARRPR